VTVLASYLEKQSFVEYREPFFGGGSMFFHLRQTRTDFSSWKVNDLFEPCANFWTVCQQDPEGLYNRVEAYRKRFGSEGRAMHKELRNEFQGLPSALDKAAAYFILNRVSFSGLTFSGGYSELSFKDRLRDSHVDSLARAGMLLNQTPNLEVSNLDYRELMKSGPERTFIFLDPPYQIGSSTLYGKNGNLHGTFSHQEFADACMDCTWANWMVTYNDSPEIKALFSSFANIREIKVKYSMNSTAKVNKELVITNW
jgi:DNA adenine methylase